VAHHGKTSTQTNLVLRPKLPHINIWLPSFGPRLLLLPKRVSPLAET
jgi:hypothetical protein